MYFTKENIAFRILSLSVFPPFIIPFIVSLRYFENINTRFSSYNLNNENKVIASFNTISVRNALGFFQP